MLIRLTVILLLFFSLAQTTESAEFATDWRSMLARQGVSVNSSQKALLIGVGQYANSDGVFLKNLAGPVNDARLLRDEFVGPILGFAPDEILVLEDGDATGAAIRTIMENWFLPGTNVKRRFFFFAGHGSFIDDLDHDEIDDFDDEVILPHDAAFDSRGEWIPSTVLIDDQWRRWFERLKGQELIAMLDTCHSGNGFRGMGTRGIDTTVRSRFAGSRGKLTKKKRPGTSRITEESVPEKHVYVYASKATQRAFERDFNGRIHGCFSQALVRGAQTLNREASAGSPVSWDNFFTEVNDRMRNTMNLDQTPAIEPAPGDKRLQQSFYAVPAAIGRPAANTLPDMDEFRIKVRIQQDRKGSLWSGDLAQLADYAVIDWTDKGGGYLLYISIDGFKQRVELSNENGYLLSAFSYNDKQDLKGKLNRRIRQAYLRGLLNTVGSVRRMPLEIKVLDDRGKPYERNDYFIDQTISYQMTGRENGYLYMLGLDGSGRLDLLYPIECQQEPVRRDKTILLPDPALCGEGVIWQLEGEPGEEMVKFIFSSRPLKIEIPDPVGEDISRIEFDQAMRIVRDLVEHLRVRDDWYSGERRYFKYTRQEYDKLY